MGFGKAFAEISTQLEEAYHARLRAFLRVFLLVRLAPTVLRYMLDAATTQGGPVSFDLRITVYPRNAWGFFRVVGALKTDEDQPDEQPAEDGPYINTLFGEKVPVSRLKTGRRRFGRRK